jgi:hypothetical protein
MPGFWQRFFRRPALAGFNPSSAAALPAKSKTTARRDRRPIRSWVQASKTSASMGILGNTPSAGIRENEGQDAATVRRAEACRTTCPPCNKIPGAPRSVSAMCRKAAYSRQPGQAMGVSSTCAD